jgi:hypothetical protein
MLNRCSILSLRNDALFRDLLTRSTVSGYVYRKQGMCKRIITTGTVLMIQ